MHQSRYKLIFLIGLLGARTAKSLYIQSHSTGEFMTDIMRNNVVEIKMGSKENALEFVASNRDKGYIIKSINKRVGKVLDINRQTGYLIMWSMHGGGNQVFTTKKRGQDKNIVSFVSEGKCLEVTSDKKVSRVKCDEKKSSQAFYLYLLYDDADIEPKVDKPSDTKEAKDKDEPENKKKDDLGADKGNTDKDAKINNSLKPSTDDDSKINLNKDDGKINLNKTGSDSGLSDSNKPEPENANKESNSTNKPQVEDRMYKDEQKPTTAFKDRPRIDLGISDTPKNEVQNFKSNDNGNVSGNRSDCLQDSSPDDGKDGTSKTDKELEDEVMQDIYAKIEKYKKNNDANLNSEKRTPKKAKKDGVYDKTHSDPLLFSNQRSKIGDNKKDTSNIDTLGPIKITGNNASNNLIISADIDNGGDDCSDDDLVEVSEESESSDRSTGFLGQAIGNLSRYEKEASNDFLPWKPKDVGIDTSGDYYKVGRDYVLIRPKKKRRKQLGKYRKNKLRKLRKSRKRKFNPISNGNDGVSRNGELDDGRSYLNEVSDYSDIAYVPECNEKSGQWKQ